VAFASARWDDEDPRRQAIGQRLPADHLVRWIDEAVGRLDLQALRQTY